MKRRVNYIELHDNLFLPGVGSLGKAFPSPLKNFDIRAYYTFGANVVEFIVNKRLLLVPLAMVKGMEVEVPREPEDITN